MKESKKTREIGSGISSNQNKEVRNEKRKDEVVKDLKKIKIPKVLGNNNFRPELVMYMGTTSHYIIVKIITNSLKTNKIPIEWKIVVIMHIFDKKQEF